MCGGVDGVRAEEGPMAPGVGDKGNSMRQLQGKAKGRCMQLISFSRPYHVNGNLPHAHTPQKT
jgi:hypothetical protein